MSHQMEPTSTFIFVSLKSNLNAGWFKWSGFWQIWLEGGWLQHEVQVVGLIAETQKRWYGPLQLQCMSCWHDLMQAYTVKIKMTCTTDEDSDNESH